jgi:hypothetical protein
MTNSGTFAAAFKGSLQSWRLWLIQFLVNALLFATFAAWLPISVSNGLRVLLNVVVILIIIFVFLTLHGGTLNYFNSLNSNEHRPFLETFPRAARNIFAILVCLIGIFLLWRLLEELNQYQYSLPPYFRSISSESIRRHFTLRFFQETLDVTFFVLRWIIFPGLTLPFLASTSSLGFRGFGSGGFDGWKRTVSSFSYWIVVAVAALVGIIATQKLMGWTPDFRYSTLRGETVSVIWRTLVSYLLALYAWMLTCSVLGWRSGRLGSTSNNVGRQPLA